MTPERFKHIKENMEKKSTEELLLIWENHDYKEWSGDAFEVIQQILTDRDPTFTPNSSPAKIKQFSDAIPETERQEYVGNGKIKFKYIQNAQLLPDPIILRAIIFDKVVTKAISSLFIWGAINLGTWAFFKDATISNLSQIHAPSGTFNTFIYGGAILGVCMLIFGIIGFATRTSIIGWLNGSSLLVVGIWNIVHDFFLADAIRPYGATLTESQPGDISGIAFIVLGIAQLIWGGKQLFRIGMLGSKPDDINSVAKDEVHANLVKLINSPENPEAGQLKFSITSGISFFQKTERFTMLLLPEKAYCLENGLGHSLVFDRQSFLNRSIFQPKILFNTNASLLAFNEWLKVE